MHLRLFPITPPIAASHAYYNNVGVFHVVLCYLYDCVIGHGKFRSLSFKIFYLIKLKT